MATYTERDQKYLNKLFKKLQGVSDSGLLEKAFYEELFASRPRVYSQDVWIDDRLIPATPPVLTNLQIYQDPVSGKDVLRYYEKLQLTPVGPGPDRYSFISPELVNSVFIPGEYEYVLFDDGDNQIFPTDDSDWQVDTATGILTFYGSKYPTGKNIDGSGANNPYISFYKYIGDTLDISQINTSVGGSGVIKDSVNHVNTDTDLTGDLNNLIYVEDTQVGTPGAQDEVTGLPAGTLTLDGVVVSDQSRILLRNMESSNIDMTTSASNQDPGVVNGIWVYDQSNDKLIRAEDANGDPLSEVRVGDVVYSIDGLSFKRNGFILNTSSVGNLSGLTIPVGSETQGWTVFDTGSAPLDVVNSDTIFENTAGSLDVDTISVTLQSGRDIYSFDLSTLPGGKDASGKKYIKQVVDSSGDVILVAINHNELSNIVTVSFGATTTEDHVLVLTPMNNDTTYTIDNLNVIS